MKKYVIIGLTLVVFLMSVGYAMFQTDLKINATSSSTNVWNVTITNVTTQSTYGSAVNNSAPTFANLSASFNAGFTKFGDYIVYNVTVKNAGNVDATLSDISVTNANSSVIEATYSGIAKGDKITAGNSQTFTFKLLYKSGKANGNVTLSLSYS